GGVLGQGGKVCISSRTAAACDRAAEAMAKLGECISIPAAAPTVEGARGLAEQIASREKRLDILVNNAGAAWGAPFDEFPESGWGKVMDLNAKSLFFLTQALTGGLVAASGDHLAKVINIASIDGISLNPQETYSYHASKAGVIQLTRRMAIRLIEDRIAVSGIAPGAFASNMNKDARDHGDEIKDSIPARRIGDPEDMAAAAIYLAARSGDYVVGSTITVDGGVTHAR